MELRHVRYFIAVAEERHFGRAARRLNIAQPALSRQIQQLEQKLGVQLFTRDRRKVELTSAGAVLLDRGRSVLKEVEQAVVATQRAGRGEVGQLEVGHAPAADMILLPRLVSEFRAKYPDVTLALRHLSGPPLLQALRDRRIQVGLLRLPIEDSDLATITLLSERLVAVLPASHPLADRDAISIKSLADERIILFPRHIGTNYFDMIGRFCLGEGGFLLNIVQESDTIQSTLGLIAAGMGISLQPESVRYMLRSGVVCKKIIESPICVETGIAYHPDDDSLVLTSFIKMAVQLYS
jgi:DNA-binding transcriptional LysR family regulator